MCKMKIHCRVNLVVKIENPSSNLLEICSYISSFLHCRFVQTKTSFLLELTGQKWFSITYKSSMKTTSQSLQMIAHCLFTSIDSNEKFREIRMQVIAVKISECGTFYTPAWEWTGKLEISGISSFVRETPAQNGRVGRYGLYVYQFLVQFPGIYIGICHHLIFLTCHISIFCLWKLLGHLKLKCLHKARKVIGHVYLCVRGHVYLCVRGHVYVC